VEPGRLGVLVLGVYLLGVLLLGVLGGVFVGLLMGPLGSAAAGSEERGNCGDAGGGEWPPESTRANPRLTPSPTAGGPA
jgi:hypothetical protein